MGETQYLAAAEVAELLGISLRTVRRRIADGTLPSMRIGGAVRIPAVALLTPELLTRRDAPDTAKREPAAREAVAPYRTTEESREEWIRRWNREHWPDTWDNMLARRRTAFAELDEVRKRTRPPSGPHDTVDAMLHQEREEFGARLLKYIPERQADKA